MLIPAEAAVAVVVVVFVVMISVLRPPLPPPRRKQREGQEQSLCPQCRNTTAGRFVHRIISVSNQKMGPWMAHMPELSMIPCTPLPLLPVSIASSLLELPLRAAESCASEYRRNPSVATCTYTENAFTAARTSTAGVQ
jgi:hypothetical protein